MEIKERGILFTAEMVRALLIGNMSVARRVMKPQPPEDCTTPGFDESGRGWFYDGLDQDGNCFDYFPRNDMGYLCPYGRPGDLLWVCETWATVSSYDNLRPSEIPKGEIRWPSIWYDSHPKAAASITLSGSPFLGKKRPSIHMPRWASRLTLRVTAVRVEQVQGITEEGARAEGVEDTDPKCDLVGPPYGYARTRFALLWDKINGRPKPVYRTVDGRKVISHYESYPWKEGTFQTTHRGRPHYVYGNPWVWVIESRRVDDAG